MLLKVVLMDIPELLYEEMEKEIRKSFSRLSEDEYRTSKLICKLKLRPMETLLLKKYQSWEGDGRVRYPPMALLKSLILKELKDISSYFQFVNYLKRYPDVKRDMGYVGKRIPSLQILSYMYTDRIDADMRKLMDFVISKIKQIAVEEKKFLDIDFLPPRKEMSKKSRRTIERHKNKEGFKIVRMLRKEIFPFLEIPLECKAKYCKENFLDLLAYVSYHNMCTNGGYWSMLDDDKFEGKVPHARTLLGYLAKLNSNEIMDMYVACFDRVFDIARRRRLLERKVDLAIDFTDWLYYGDKSDTMVVFSEYKNGTDKRFRYVTIKIAEKYGDFTLIAFPIGVFSNERKIVKKLIEYAKERVSPRYFFVDRGFYSSKYISLFEEMGIKYLMPAIRNRRILKIAEKYEAPAVIDIKLKDTAKKYITKTKLVIRKSKDGEKLFFFATNLPSLMLYSVNLSRLYKKRWSIETSYRVKKYEFRPGTTSKNYRIRMFYFMFSCLLYNLWVITNAVLSDYLFGRQVNHRIIMAKMFMKKFYEAYKDYVP